MHTCYLESKPSPIAWGALKPPRGSVVSPHMPRLAGLPPRRLDVGRCGITLPGSLRRLVRLWVGCGATLTALPRRLVVAEERAGTNRRSDGIFKGRA